MLRHTTEAYIGVAVLFTAYALGQDVIPSTATCFGLGFVQPNGVSAPALAPGTNCVPFSSPTTSSALSSESSTFSTVTLSHGGLSGGSNSPSSSLTTISVSTTTATGSSTIATGGVSTIPPTPSTTSSNPPKKGLSSGAKAGIAIAVIIFAILFLLAGFLLKRRQNRNRHQEPETEDSKENAHLPAELPPSYPKLQELPSEKPLIAITRKELATSANTHEMDTSRRVESQTVQDGRGTATQQTDSSQPSQLLVSQEYDASSASPTVPSQSTLNSDMPVPVVKQTFSQPFPDSSPSPYDTLSAAQEGREVGSSSEPSPVTPDTAAASGSARVDELRAKKEKIRIEKERLLKLQELDEREAALQQEIMEEERKARRGV